MGDERLKNIELLSELRSQYSCFDEKEEPYYRALSAGIAAIREQIYANNGGQIVYLVVESEDK